ncbi:DUF262 domain-containing protein [Aquella oligotrophica]|uniref:GmrSD restriction endonucleases N-terminal domain-containing protein n=1 Tax=Aquella oligotrophica TaxID=2067065 RepID=A0A2I7N4L7_9NEIS|nr:DUF262 domain-containing protein [Aquella oligotrophica]AUR51416.1 hypothetical protein CUN60_03590 [Aquella oligotrophica]
MSQKQMELLTSQIEKERKIIKTDSYAISIGELIAMYKDNELELTPNYQRLFRWDNDHKTKFIESIIIGIPLPPIFVAQKKGATWNIVDGLQRVSTILQLSGDLKLKLPNGEEQPPLTFIKPEKLTAMEGLTWETLDDDTKRIIRRTKLDVKIIVVEDNYVAQYELFKRLNTGAVHLEPQEIRNCLIIMLNEEFYEKINELKDFEPFRNCIALQPKKYEIEYHMELILRYLILKHNNIDFARYNSYTLLSDFFDEEAKNLVLDGSLNLNLEIETFKRVFRLLDSLLQSSVFRKYNSDRCNIEGGFSTTLFDVITLGISSNLDKYEQLSPQLVIEKIRGITNDSQYNQNSDRGIKAITRIKSMIEFSKNYFTE